jgi:5-methylcytosine-specific restriction protein A
MENGKIELQHILEKTFDIPFHVESGIANSDPWYKIKPAEHPNESFTIHISFVNQLRLNIEFSPDTYSVPLLKDMSNSTPDQRMAFLGYAKVLVERKAKIDFAINNIDVSITDYSAWPQDWQNIRLKITKSPITEENETFAPEEIIVDWGCLFTGMVLSLLNIVPIDDYKNAEGVSEGDHSRVFVNRYERSPVNRNLCLAAKGYSCKVCGMDFQKIYGKLGIGFIHVHHIVPVSKMGPKYVVDPLNDLEPVCPNCHSMLHRREPPLEIDELRKIIADNNGNIDFLMAYKYFNT